MKTVFLCLALIGCSSSPSPPVQPVNVQMQECFFIKAGEVRFGWTEASRCETGELTDV